MSSYDTSHVDVTVKWTYETGDRVDSSSVVGSDDHKVCFYWNITK